MAITNSERVGKALDLLKDGLRPYVERELKATYKDRWIDDRRAQVSLTGSRLGKTPRVSNWDTQALPQVMCELWNDCFKKILGPSDRNRRSSNSAMCGTSGRTRKPFPRDDAY